MSFNKGKIFTIQGALTDISIANTGSGSATILANPDRNYLFIGNPNAFLVGVNLAGGAASVGASGTMTIAANGSISFQDGYIPTNAITVCGSSGGGVAVFQG